MVISLSKGGTVSLTKEAPGLSLVQVGLGWEARTTVGEAFDLDASAIVCDDSGRVLSESWFVFYNNLTSPGMGVVHTGDNTDGSGDGDDETINVDLSKLPPEAQRIIVVVSLHDAAARGQNFGQVRNAYIRLVNSASQGEVARYDLAEDYSTETAMVFGELYRRDAEWKFRAVGQGYNSGLIGVLADYGINAS